MSNPTANVQPIWVAKPDLSNNNGTGTNQLVTAAVGSDYTGVSANYSLVHTAGADGSRIDRLKFTAGGTNVQTVARIFANNGSAPTTAANNEFLGEVQLPATAASNTTVMVSPEWVPPGGMGLTVPPGWRIYVGLATAVAAGWACAPIAGQY